MNNFNKGLLVVAVVMILSVVCVLYFLSRNNMIWKDRYVYSYKRKNPTVFPKIIHQTYKTADLDPDRKKWQKTILEMYPGYQYNLWLDDDMEKFAQENFPEYMDTWNKLTPFIKKIDAIRYMWMYKIGGIYFDLDIYVKQNMEHLLTGYPGSAFIPTSHDTPDWSYDSDKTSPAILASCPGNPVWLEMLEYIKNNIDRPVLKCTGPIGLANVLLGIHKRNESEKPDIVFLSEPRLGIGLKIFGKYSHHVNTKSWPDVSSSVL